jgi:hypothetical protein
MKKLMLLVLIFNISSLFAQGQAFTKHPVTKEEYATAIEKNDKSILRIDCEKLVQAVQNAWPELKIRDKYDLADYIRSLVEMAGPIGPAKFSRVFKNGAVDFNWTRDVKEGEILLFDNNRAEYKFSLSCGNMTFGIPVLNVFEKSKEKKAVEKEKEIVKKSISDLTIEFNYYNSFNTSETSSSSGFKPFSFRNLAWEIPLTGLIIWAIVEIIEALKPHHREEIRLSDGGILPPN